MAFDQTYCMDTLAAATRPEADSSEFIYAFLDAYGFPKATITQVRNDGQRNVASRKTEGHVALKNWLYFMPVRQGESIHEALQVLADEDEPARHRCRFLMVTDFRELTALDTKTDERLEVGFSELATQYLFFAPMAGLERTKHFEEASADLKAAAKMGRLFDRLKEVNEFSTPEQLHALNVFLTRLLFCYFAEDTGIFPKNAFTKVIIEASGDNGEELPDLLAQLFRVMNQPENERPADLAAHVAQFPYVNGGLFRDDLPVPEIRGKGRRMMIECGQLAWEAVNPDIFGSMFQAVVDEESRDALGQHYTSVPNIMKVIRPLFLDKLYAELHKSKGNRKKLETLLERLTRIRVFDPAMGSGNFLIISYKELRRLEMAVFRALQEVSGQQEIFMSGIRLSQFYGIEIDDFAHEVAQLSLWLAEHQMNILFAKEFGHVEPLLPLKDTGSLVSGNSLRICWEEVCPLKEDVEIYVCGNPPFVGQVSRGASQVSDMKEVLGRRVRNFKSLDYVSCWLVKAAEYCGLDNVEAAFVSTNSICQGKQVALLWPVVLEMGVKISFAYQTFAWRNSAKGNAGVHVVIIGLSKKLGPRFIFQRLDNGWHRKDVKNISPYLLDGGDVVVSERRAPLVAGCPRLYFGSMPNDGGHLLLNKEEYDSLIVEEPKSEPWIRRLLGAKEFLQGHNRWCLWLKDIDNESLERMPLVKERVERVRQYRLGSDRGPTAKRADTPHEFAEVRHQEGQDYILVPKVTSERREYSPVGMFTDQVIATDLAMIVPGGTLYEFSLLSTQMHMDWLRLVGGRLKSDYRYSASLVYNTFPWPEVSERQRQEIEQLGRAVILARAAHPDKTMAQLYDPDKMPDNLLEAHHALDRAVEKLYRNRPFRDTAERQEYLLARYEELIEAEKTAKTGNRKSRKATEVEG
ncbi:class I SAM-dependent DNA methyltransferase [Halomonas sp. KAO]|uniref:class I SAM-dependent DNA methyltransferase n=1 Tax=Halomonas sp. KAO TaxID=2783858 RepID=UPI0018A0DB1A|nr:class I SAM-dependent DNA methyltransferase [Halomonas sp. KAO]MBF7052428.1 class I SAM-dependent DNA methyltransferase [Halomonas sp. KAO]